MLHAMRRALSYLLLWMLLGGCFYFLLLWMVQVPAQSLAWGSVKRQDLPGTVRLLPNPAFVDVGQMVTVEVWLENAGNYYGIDIRLSFDSHYGNVPAGRVTPLWDVIDRNNHFIIKNEVDNASGMVWYAVINLNPAEPFTGTGRLFVVAFSGLEVGSSDLHFTYAKGSTRAGESLYPQMVDGSIIVQQPVRFELYLPIVSRSFREEM